MVIHDLIEILDRMIDTIADAEETNPELSLAHELAQQLRDELDSILSE